MSKEISISLIADGSPFGEVTENSFKKDGFSSDTEEILKTLFVLLPAGVAILDVNHRIIDFNLALGKILGINEEGLKNRAYDKRKYFRLDGTRMPQEEFPSRRAEMEQRIINRLLLA